MAWAQTGSSGRMAVVVVACDGATRVDPSAMVTSSHHQAAARSSVQSPAQAQACQGLFEAGRVLVAIGRVLRQAAEHHPLKVGRDVRPES